MAVRDIIQAAGGSAATSAAVYVEDVFSTYVYTGTGASQTITNGIDLSTNGGMVWIKDRVDVYRHCLFDTARGANKALYSNLTAAEATLSGALTSFGTTGFTNGSASYVNMSGDTFASWTFRKQAKFFDVVTYTGDGTNNRSIAHSLGVTPGFIMIKKTSAISNWITYCSRDATNASVMRMNTTDAQLNNFAKSNNSSSTFMVQQIGDYTTGAPGDNMNDTGSTYVAYLFADSNSGGFGAAGADSVVACGSYTGNGSASGPTVTLGWEPQYILVKGSSTAGDAWSIVDNMRELTASGSSKTLYPHLSNAEASGVNTFGIRATGFQVATVDTDYNRSGSTYIYLAIRRGPMKTPTDATKVFKPVTRTGTGSAASITGVGFTPDLLMTFDRSGSFGEGTFDRLRGKDVVLYTNATTAESSQVFMDGLAQDGFSVSGGGANTNVNNIPYSNWFFRRAPGFFDVVCYTGTGSATTVAHNLGVAPELMIVKKRNSASIWVVYSKTLGNTGYIVLNGNYADGGPFSGYWNATPTSSTVSLGSDATVNGSGSTYVAYLFASCPGVSKVFNFTGNGSSQTINCGFASGARFVLIKRTDAAGDWWVYDSARGIVSAADPALKLNSAAAEVTSADAIDPDSSGFIVNQEATCNINVNNATYIGLAIA